MDHPCHYLSHFNGPFAEMVRGLRTNLLIHYKNKLRSFLLTSCWPGEGKSTVCINLAAALVESGLRVLLVDGDLRQRRLSDLLLGESCADSLELQSTNWIPGVSVLPAPRPSSLPPGDRLAQAEYRALVQAQFQRFDVTLVDSPPLSACSDALILCKWVDGVLMVCAQDRFQGIPEGHFSEDVRDSGGRILGVVITGIALTSEQRRWSGQRVFE